MRNHLGDIVKYLGKDAFGFRYYASPDLYVYQRFPNKDHFFNKTNMRNKWNGWMCSLTAWENAINEILV